MIGKNCVPRGDAEDVRYTIIQSIVYHILRKNQRLSLDKEPHTQMRHSDRSVGVPRNLKCGRCSALDGRFDGGENLVLTLGHDQQDGAVGQGSQLGGLCNFVLVCQIVFKIGLLNVDKLL